MADFTGSGWSVYIMVVTAISLAFCLWITVVLSKKPPAGERVGTTGHTWDETLEEMNNPLPRWWIYLFYLTIVFAVVYLLRRGRCRCSGPTWRCTWRPIRRPARWASACT